MSHAKNGDSQSKPRHGVAPDLICDALTGLTIFTILSIVLFSKRNDLAHYNVRCGVLRQSGTVADDRGILENRMDAALAVLGSK